MVEGLEHFQLIVDHLLIPTDILLQNNLDGDLSSGGGLGFADDTICSCTEGSSEPVQSSISVMVSNGRGSGRVNGVYFFS